MCRRTLMTVALSALLSGCVSQAVHTQTLAELEQARNANESAKKAHEGVTAKLNAVTEELNRAKQSVELLTSELSVHTQTLAELEQARNAHESAKKGHQAVTAKLDAVTEELGRTEQRVELLTSELSSATQEVARTRQANDVQARKQQESLREAETALERLRQEQQNLRAQLQLEQSEKDREIQRLTQTQADLATSLQAEIAKGEIRIQQVADRLMINMVDRVLFDSGQGHVKPAGLKVLKQVSDILKTVKDKQIRIEGHTDNVRIGGKLKERFATNWELSTTRATSVVRYLLDEGGLDASNISAVGYADMRPIASNETEEGRLANRRIEIVLYPKDLQQIVGKPEPGTNGLTATPKGQ
jgi:chemotaxis protein MotB